MIFQNLAPKSTIGINHNVSHICLFQEKKNLLSFPINIRLMKSNQRLMFIEINTLTDKNGALGYCLVKP